MPSSPHEILVHVARLHLGVSEHHDAHMIEIFRKAVDGLATGEPWCVGFAFWCISRAEKITGKRSPLFRSESVISVWEKSPVAHRRTAPRPGCLSVWQKGVTRAGHMGIVTEIAGGRQFVTVEGNTTPRPGSGIDRDGGGVYEKIRVAPGSTEFKLLGFLDPWGGA